jgi:DNA-directed RNA polymerase subunit RPC12/RpoP
MSIQFFCAQCNQPIEVDDEHAGQTAACPFCRHVMTIPRESTYRAEAAVAARPLSPPAGSANDAEVSADEGPPPEWRRRRPPVPPPRQRAANTFGSYGLVCALLALLLLGIAVVRATTIAARSGKFTSPTPPTPADMTELQEQMAKDPWFVGPQIGAAFFALVGLPLGIISMVQAPQGNWRGLTTIIICGLFFLCMCAGFGLHILGMG